MSVEELEKWILKAWSYYYEPAEEFGSSAFDVLAPYDINDLLENLEDLELDDANSAFIEKLRIDFDEIQWFPLGKGEIRGVDEMFYNWETFCNIVKHERRYFFFDYNLYDYSSSPKSTLESIVELIHGQEIVTKISPDIKIYRARNFNNNEDVSCLKATNLGTPKVENAIHENRFSPAGISLFYGSLDPNTAREEIGKVDGNIIIGEFHTLTEINVIDFTALPEIPSIYDEEYRDISGISFLHDFSAAITSPVDSNSPIDYIPTQVFTEFIRKKFGETIKGIKYRSAKSSENSNVVLFYKNEDCVDFDAIFQKKEGVVLQNFFNFT